MSAFDDTITLEELLAMQRPAWHRDAACREHPEINWFPERGQSSAPAKAVCRRCLVSNECAAAGMTEQSGVWGGLATRDRRRSAA